MDIDWVIGLHSGVKFRQRGLSFFTDSGPYRGLRFVTVPKCASTSIRHSLNLYLSGGLKRPRFSGRGDFPARFCVLREPLDRFVSGYCELLRRGPSDVLPRFAAEGFWGELDLERQFDGFVRVWSYYGPFEEHCSLQSYFVGGVKMSYYLRFERLGADLNRMLWRVGLPGVNLSVENSFDPPVKSLVAELVKRPVYRDLIMKWLRFDYELLGSVRFFK